MIPPFRNFHHKKAGHGRSHGKERGIYAYFLKIYVFIYVDFLKKNLFYNIMVPGIFFDFALRDVQFLYKCKIRAHVVDARPALPIQSSIIIKIVNEDLTIAIVGPGQIIVNEH